MKLHIFERFNFWCKNTIEPNRIFNRILSKDPVLAWPGYIYIYRVSHCKVNKVIWLCWGYRFWFLLIFFILHVDEIWPFMPNPSLFIFLMLRALYGSISQHFLFLYKFWIILTFRGLFQVIKSNNPSKMYIFPLS